VLTRRPARDPLATDRQAMAPTASRRLPVAARLGGLQLAGASGRHGLRVESGAGLAV